MDLNILYELIFGPAEYEYSLIGALISAGVGLYSAVKGSSEASKSRRSANQAAARAHELDKEALEFSKQQYADWKSVFGDVAENLSNYYENLSPEYQTARGLEAFEMEKDKALTTLRETLDQRGLGTSGAAVQVEQDFAEFSASERARIRAEAPKEVAREKMNFLTAGLNTNPANNVQGALNARASNASSRANLAAELSSDAQASKVGAIGEAIKGVGTVLEETGLFDKDD